MKICAVETLRFGPKGPLELAKVRERHRPRHGTRQPRRGPARVRGRGGSTRGIRWFGNRDAGDADRVHGVRSTISVPRLSAARTVRPLGSKPSKFVYLVMTRATTASKSASFPSKCA